MRTAILLIVFALTGCASQITHTARPMAVDDARAIIERVLMEQPAKHRPSAVAFSDTYIALQMGTVSKGRAAAVPVGFAAVGSSTFVATELNTRIYYDTMAGARLHKKRSWYVLDVVNGDGRILQRVYCLDETKALRFVDAIEALRS